MRSQCLNCRERGHELASCPQLLFDIDHSKCFKCGSIEHRARQCEEKVAHGALPFAKCFICGEVGHLSRSCLDNPNGTNESEDEVCSNCRQPGHDLASCPQVNHGMGVCYKCGSTEHKARTCKVQVAQNEFPFAKCFVCGQVGHMSGSCPNNTRSLYPDDSLYHLLPEEILSCQQRGSITSTMKSNQLLSAFLQRYVQRKQLNEGLEKSLKYEQMAVVLSNRIVRHNRVKTQRTGKALTARQFRQSRLLRVDQQDAIYKLYQPLHELWKDYICDVINFNKVTDANMQDVARQLMNADLHASLLQVTESRCPALVGLSGLVLQETKNAFVLVTTDNKLKTVPKQNSVFTLHVQGHVFTIHGNNFRQRASERCIGSFKNQKTVDL